MSKRTVNINIRFPEEIKKEIDKAVETLNKGQGPGKTSINSFVVWAVTEKIKEINEQ